MPSPFPGMDPWLEGHLWPDVHHALASQIRRQLMPRLRPRYVARIEVRMVRDETPEAEVGIMYPDVEIVTARHAREASEPPTLQGGGSVATLTVTPAHLEVPLLQPEVRVAAVQVRDAAQDLLVTSIEILSPVNKREPGLSDYREKRRQLQQAGVHLLELDLLRRGTRPFHPASLPETDYLFTLVRAGARSASLWPTTLHEPLPVLPVPLRDPDPDVPLDLGQALRDIYDEAAYDLSIRYDKPPPPPPLSQAQQQWVAQQLRLPGAGSA